MITFLPPAEDAKAMRLYFGLITEDVGELSEDARALFMMFRPDPEHAGLYLMSYRNPQLFR